MISIKNDARKQFLKKGTCSRTFFFLLNREYGHPREAEERAVEQLAGGIMQMGYQCGMLWGASMAVGAESFRRHDNPDEVISTAITATKHLMESFSNLTNTNDCSEITDTDFSSKIQFVKFLFTKAPACYGMAKKWAPEAINAANEGLEKGQNEKVQKCKSCASEVVMKMGGSDEQAAMAAGLAGGMGLSGNACGALSSAIWMKAIEWSKKQPKKTSFPASEAKIILDIFYKETDYKILCSEITEQSFNSINEHTEYINNGGCEKLIDILSKS